jgi:hypothetical protein
MKRFFSKTLKGGKSKEKMKNRDIATHEGNHTRQMQAPPPPPPTHTTHHHYHEQEEIDIFDRRNRTPSPPPSTTSRSMKMEDIDQCIGRLLHVGRNKSMVRTVCLDQDEIVAICRIASNTFIQQPVI